MTSWQRALVDPLYFGQLLWPRVRFYRKQRQIIESVETNLQTYVPAAHQMGKDFVTAFVALRYFLIHHPVRVVTTSIVEDHLRILWGELGRFIDTSAVPLKQHQGGPLRVLYQDVYKDVGGRQCPISYLRGMVAKDPEKMAGHHAPYTLFIGDEASGLADAAYERAETWAKRMLIIGNPYPCQNFFFKAVKAGDVLLEE